jgi:hypothetical protein
LSQLLLHRVAQVADQMKAIRDLAGLWRAPTNALGIRTMAIAADRADARACGEPRRHGISGAGG